MGREPSAAQLLGPGISLIFDTISISYSLLSLFPRSRPRALLSLPLSGLSISQICTVMARPAVPVVNSLPPAARVADRIERLLDGKCVQLRKDRIPATLCTRGQVLGFIHP